MPMRFAGRTVLVTGASRGIGEQLVRDFAAEGAACILVARTTGDLERVRGELPEPERHLCVPCDVSSAEAVTGMGAWVLQEKGAPDVLVNNAGISRYTRFVDTPLADLEALMETNYWGVVHCCRAFLPGMLERGSGHVVNVSSIAGRIGTDRHAGYSASKFAVTGFSESLYYELLGTGVRVMLVNPGVIETHLFDHASFQDFPESARKMMRPPSLVSRAVLRAVARGTGKFEITVPRGLWAGVVVKAVCPPLFRDLHARFLRRG